ncbi:MAG: hypothetical protein ACK45U_01105, partial [bacterium]
VYDNNNNLLTSNFSQYMLNDGTLLSADSIKNYYTNNTTIGIEKSYETLNVYPNPTSNNLYFNLN